MPIAYEIVNPSDQCTVVADDFRIAAAATLLLGNGSYGAIPEDENGQSLPVFFLWSREDIHEWLKAECQIDDFDSFIEAHADTIAECLESFLYGGFEDRKIFERVTTLADSSEKLMEFKAKWQDERRSSMTNIGRGAENLARELRRISEGIAKVG